MDDKPLSHGTNVLCIGVDGEPRHNGMVMASTECGRYVLVKSIGWFGWFRYDWEHRQYVLPVQDAKAALAHLDSVRLAS